jgi:hypothetical protein
MGAWATKACSLSSLSELQSYPILFYSILSYLILFNPILSYPTQSYSYPIQYFPTLSYPIQSYFISCFSAVFPLRISHILLLLRFKLVSVQYCYYTVTVIILLLLLHRLLYLLFIFQSDLDWTQNNSNCFNKLFFFFFFFLPFSPCFIMKFSRIPLQHLNSDVVLYHVKSAVQYHD